MESTCNRLQCFEFEFIVPDTLMHVPSNEFICDVTNTNFVDSAWLRRLRDDDDDDDANDHRQPAMTRTTTTTKKTTTTDGLSTTTVETTTTTTTTTNNPTTKLGKLNWTRLNYKGADHDNRRLLEHRAKNCECEVCFREIHKLPPAEPIRHKLAARHSKLKEREIKKAKRNAKKDVKAGKQACIRNFFRY